MTYLVIAYGVVFTVLIVYVASLARRQARLRREIEALRRHQKVAAQDAPSQTSSDAVGMTR